MSPENEGSLKGPVILFLSMDTLSKLAASWIAIYLTCLAAPSCLPQCKPWAQKLADTRFLDTAWPWITTLFLSAHLIIAHHAWERFIAWKGTLATLLQGLDLAAIMALIYAGPLPSERWLHPACLAIFITFVPSIAPSLEHHTWTLAQCFPPAASNALILKARFGRRLVIPSPQLGIFVLGAPGSGKTKFVVEPLLLRMIQQGYAGILYDYDCATKGHDPTYSLSTLTHHLVKNHAKGNLKALSINFQDLATSARFNPIHPGLIHDRKRLAQALKVLLRNLAPEIAQKEDFWFKNTYALLKALVVWFDNQLPAQCDLPHVIMLGLQPTDQLLELIAQDQEAALYASPILDAKDKAPEQLAGVMANFKVALDTLVDPTLFWVLGGHELPTAINEPKQPHVVCLGNTPTQRQALSPIIAMMISSLATQLYGHHRAKSFLLIDELPTLWLPDLNEIPATARKYGVATVVALQHLAQLEKAYGKQGAQELEETFSNQLVGRSQYEVARRFSEQLGMRSQEQDSRTYSEGRLSRTMSPKEVPWRKPQALMQLRVGEFVGRTAQQGALHAQLLPLKAYGKQLDYRDIEDLPQRRETPDTEAYFQTVQQEVAQIARKGEPS